MKTLLISLLILASCSQPIEKNVVRVSFQSDPATLDPTKNGEQISSTLHFMLFEGLTKMTPESNAAPAMANKISVSKDGTHYTFHLRKAYWSDGTRVRAHDFEYAWKLQLRPDYPSPNAHLLYPIKGATKAKLGQGSLIGIHSLSDDVLEVELEQPTPYFLELTSFCPFFPIPSHIAKEHPNWAQGNGLVCNGPFLLNSWAHNNRLLLLKNTSYWNAQNVSIEKIEIAIIKDDNTALDLFEKKELDIIGCPFNSIPLDAMPALKDSLITYPTAATTICPFNLKNPLFQNKNIRRAMAIAISRKTICDNIMQHGEQVATGPVPPSLKNGKNISYFPDGDQIVAKMLFAKGCDELNIDPHDFPTLTLSYASEGWYGRVAQALQEQWKTALGINIELKQLDFKLLLDDLIKRKYEIALIIWIAQYADQMNILDRFKSPSNPKNYPGWENTTYAELLEKSMIAGPIKRLWYLEEAETLFSKEMPLIPIFHWQTAYMMNPSFKGYYISPIGSIHLENAYKS